MQIVQSPLAVTLAECPPGLFVTPDGHLGLKTEYHCPHNGIDAYVAESGEYFWGGVNNKVDRANLLVHPATYQ